MFLLFGWEYDIDVKYKKYMTIFIHESTNIILWK